MQTSPHTCLLAESCPVWEPSRGHIPSGCWLDLLVTITSPLVKSLQIPLIMDVGETPGLVSVSEGSPS